MLCLVVYLKPDKERDMRCLSNVLLKARRDREKHRKLIVAFGADVRFIKGAGSSIRSQRKEGTNMDRNPFDL